MRIIKAVALGLLLILILGILVFRYYLNIDTPEQPSLSAAVQRETLDVNGLQRQFSFYRPAALQAGAPLVFVLHGSQSQGTDMSQMTGYQFDRLADKYGFIAVYPDGYQRHWNDCRAGASYAANTENIDDISFFRAMIAFFIEQDQIASDQVFATGFSNGGHMVYKLAYEMPRAFSGIAAIAANLPIAENSDCTPTGEAISVAIFNGTEDPVNPYEGGLVEVFGDTSRGTVLSSQETTDYWVQLADIQQPPIEVELPEADGNLNTRVTLAHWAHENGTRISLYTLHGSGHVVPSKVVSFGAFMGENAGDLEAAEEIWDFFQSLRPQK